MTPTYKIIANPVAGRGAGNLHIPQIEQTLEKNGLDFQLTRTECPMHARDLAIQAVQDGFKVVVASGGDGTCNEVLNGLMEAQKMGIGEACMAVLCVGRGNDFAFGMGIPTRLEDGLNTLMAGNRRRIDVGIVTGGLYPEGRYFGNGVGIGFDATVGFVSAKMTRLSGFPSYIVAALKTITLYYNAPLVRIEYDGQELVQPSIMVSIMNGRRMGGGFMMAPHSRPDDNYLDMCVAHEMSRFTILRTIPSFFKGTQADKPNIWTGRARQITVTALNGFLPAHADGETLCTEGKQLVMGISPYRLELICDANLGA
ncbi:MAG: diacylglycerol kinase family lipid kinase [Anaerolineaceae bacterium]|nr:diacylglycerol kinase family lipid kinase [Anaerolineaceae bacterium]